MFRNTFKLWRRVLALTLVLTLVSPSVSSFSELVDENESNPANGIEFLLSEYANGGEDVAYDSLSNGSDFDAEDTMSLFIEADELQAMDFDAILPMTDTSLPFTITADSGSGTLTIGAGDPGETTPPISVEGQLELIAGIQNVERDFDQTVMISVYNPTDNPMMYYLVSDNRYPAYELALNFVYASSIYEPTVILSGETHQVPLSVFTQSAMRTSYNIPITAYVVENGTVTSDTVETLTLQVPAVVLDLTITETAFDENTLARTFSILNNGADISDLTLSLSGDVAQFARISPGVEIYQLAQGATLAGIDIVPDIAGLYAANRSVVTGWMVAQSGATTQTVPVNIDATGLLVEHIPLGRLAPLQAENPFWNLDIGDVIGEPVIDIDTDGFNFEMSYYMTFGDNERLTVSIAMSGTVFDGDTSSFEDLFAIVENGDGTLSLRAETLIPSEYYEEWLNASGGLIPFGAFGAEIAPSNIGGTIHFVIDVLLEFGTYFAGLANRVGLGRLLGGLSGVSAAIAGVLWYRDLVDNAECVQASTNLRQWQRDLYVGAAAIEGFLIVAGVLLTIAFPHMGLPLALALGVILAYIGWVSGIVSGLIADAGDCGGNGHVWEDDILGYQCTNVPRLVNTIYGERWVWDWCCNWAAIGLSEGIMPFNAENGEICPQVQVIASSRMGYGRTASRAMPNRWERTSTGFANSINGNPFGEQTVYLSDIAFVEIPTQQLQPGDNRFQRDFTTNPGHFFFSTDTRITFILPPQMEVGFIGDPGSLPNVRSLPDLAVYLDSIFVYDDHLIVGEPSRLMINYFNRGSRGAWYVLRVYQNDVLIHSTRDNHGDYEYPYMAPFSSDSLSIDWTPTAADNDFRVELITMNVGIEEIRLENNVAERGLTARPRQVPNITAIAPSNVTLDEINDVWATADIANHLDVSNVTFAVNNGAPVTASTATRGANIRASAEINGLVPGDNTVVVAVTYYTGFGNTATITQSHTLNVYVPGYVPVVPPISFSVDSGTVGNFVFRVFNGVTPYVGVSVVQGAAGSFTIERPAGMAANPRAFNLMVISNDGIVVANLDDLDSATLTLADPLELNFATGTATVASVYVAHVVVGGVQLPVSHTFFDMDRILFSRNITQVSATADFTSAGVSPFAFEEGISTFSDDTVQHYFNVYLPYSIDFDPFDVQFDSLAPAFFDTILPYAAGSIPLPDPDVAYLTFIAWPDKFTEGSVSVDMGSPMTAGLFDPITVSEGMRQVELSLSRQPDVSATFRSTRQATEGSNTVVTVGSTFDGDLVRIGSTDVTGGTNASVNIHNMWDAFGNELRDYTATNYDDQLVGVATFTNVANPSDVIELAFNGTIASLASGGSISLPIPNVAGTFSYSVVLSTDRSILPDPVEDTFPLTIVAGTGGVIASGASGTFAAGTAIQIQAQANAGFQFSNWTTSQGGTFANANSASTTFTMPANAVTITANFTATQQQPTPPTGQVGGGGGGGGQATPAPSPRPRVTIPANNGAVDVPVRIANGRITLELPANRVNQLVDTAVNSTVIFDLSSAEDVNTAVMSRAALIRFANEELAMRITSEHGVVEFSAYDLAELVESVTAPNVSIDLEPAEITLEVDMPPPYEPPILPPPTQDMLRFAIGSTAYTINGIPRTIDAAPFIEGDRTMVPVRFIAEAMGATVGWIGETRTVTIDMGTANLQLTIDVPLPDGMGTPAIVSNRTFVPIRYVSETLGATVRWDEAARAVYIYLS